MAIDYYTLGGIFSTEVIPAALGLFTGYKVLKYFEKKKNEKTNQKQC